MQSDPPGSTSSFVAMQRQQYSEDELSLSSHQAVSLQKEIEVSVSMDSEKQATACDDAEVSAMGDDALAQSQGASASAASVAGDDATGDSAALACPAPEEEVLADWGENDCSEGSDTRIRILSARRFQISAA